MAEKTIVDKAGESVGVGIAMASDVAGAIKTAFGAAVTTVAEILTKPPAKKGAAKKAAKKAPAEKPAKKAVAPAKKSTKKAGAKKAAKKGTPERARQESCGQDDSV
jgi:hypothetical protein